MMYKIAVIFESSPFDRKGLFNAVHNRIKHLLDTGECWIDAYCIHSWDTPFTQKKRGTPYVAERVPSVEIDGITYRLLWYDFSVMDHITVKYLHRKPLFFSRFLKRTLPRLEGYDFIVAHSFTGALFANAASQAYGMPYFVTWHGSDIHTHPWRNPLILSQTRTLMQGASCNFFVSEALMRRSDDITSEAKKEVLYNGVSEDFMRFCDQGRKELRAQNGIAEGEKVVAFVGSLVPVKNVSALQPLFHEIKARYTGPLQFWVVGDGKLRSSIEPALRGDSSINVQFFGNISAELMPSVMNCIDVMVLPSLNEGLPLVCAEAICCGANVVGSDVGGITEVIGQENVVPLDNDFIAGMASKVVEMLTSETIQTIPAALDWTAIAAKEYDFIESYDNV